MRRRLRRLPPTGFVTGLATGPATASAQTVAPKAGKEAAGEAGVEGPSGTTGIKGVGTPGAATPDGAS